MSLMSFALRRAFRRSDDKRDAGLTTPEDVARFDDIVYGPDHKWNVLDVYRPKGAEGALPVIVSVHGGGWVYGDKERYQYYGMSLAQQGFADAVHGVLVHVIHQAEGRQLRRIHALRSRVRHLAPHQPEDNLLRKLLVRPGHTGQDHLGFHGDVRMLAVRHAVGAVAAAVRRRFPEVPQQTLPTPMPTLRRSRRNQMMRQRRMTTAQRPNLSLWPRALTTRNRVQAMTP